MLEENQFQKMELEMIYDPRGNNNDINIGIFGGNFVENNKDKCKIIYKNKEYELKEGLEDIDINYNYSDIIILTLRIFKNINDMSFMFNECIRLVSFSEKPYLQDSQQENNIKINQLNPLINYNVTNMSQMFDGCHSLISLPDISNWDTSNIINMSRIFSGCQSLKKMEYF